MLDPENVPPVVLDESVSRFVLALKASRLVFEDGKAKPQLFYPYKHVKLSVNRHLECTAENASRTF